MAGAARRTVQCWRVSVRCAPCTWRTRAIPFGAHMAEQRTLPQFLEALGSSAPTPGGGAASALAAALAAALAEMVARLTAGRAGYQEADAAMRAVIAKAAGVRQLLLALIEEDERAHAGGSAAFRLPKTTDDERALRDAAVQVALV